MHPDLDRLIRLQQIENDAEMARRAIKALPDRRAAAEQAVHLRQAELDAAEARFAESTAARRVVEKDLAMQQGRLTKFKDQLMEVKTNREYTAMQHEIATADAEVKRLEDLVLERLLEGDELASAVASARVALQTAQRDAAATIETLASEQVSLDAAIADAARRRDEVARGLDRPWLDLFDSLLPKRARLAVVEARDGHCSVCHVRLRPQLYNELRKNETIIQCDSCQRILYYVPPSPGAASGAAS